MVCDPIVFMMHFDAITSNEAEAVINNAASTVLSYTSPYIKRWIEEFSTPIGLNFSGCNGLSEPDNYGVELSKLFWSDSEIDHWIATFIERTGRSSVVSWFLNDISLRNSIKKHSSKPNELFKKYKRCFNSKNGFDKKQLINLLNCPNDSLSEIQYPISYLGANFFEISKSCYSVNEDYALGLDGRLGKDLFLHELDVSIPRILLGSSDSIRALQDILIRLLLTLGAEYPYCRGSIRLDVPLQYGVQALNVIDNHLSAKENTRYYDRVLPGYAWGMLWNGGLASLIPLTQEDEKAFRNIIKLPNGNLWLQCSDWVDLLSREQNVTAVKTLAKYSRIPRIPLSTATFPSSIRFAIDENDLTAPDDDHPETAWIDCLAYGTNP